MKHKISETYFVTGMLSLTAFIFIMRFVEVPLDILRVPFAISVAVLVAFVVLTIFLRALSPVLIRGNLERVGLINRYGEAPVLLSLKDSDKVSNGIILEFENRNIPREVFDQKRADLEAALNLFITRIADGKNRRRIIIEAVPADQGLSDIIPWSQDYLVDDDTTICLGMGLTGLITRRIDIMPHAMIGGSTGSGKSVMTRSYIYQCLMKGMTVFLADFKGGLDFLPFQQHKSFHLVTTPEEFLECLQSYAEEIERRKQILLRAECANLAEYNQKNPYHQHRRILIAVDELAEVMDRTGRTKEEKHVIDEITGHLSSIARLGRAVGVHLLLSQQRPDMDVLGGQIKSNIPLRLCSRADSVLSTIVLGNGEADKMIPKESRGLFVTNGADSDDMILFRGFWFDPAQIPREQWETKPLEVCPERESRGKNWGGSNEC